MDSQPNFSLIIYVSDLHMQIAENAGLLKVDSHLQEHYKGLRNSSLTGNVFFHSLLIHLDFHVA